MHSYFECLIDTSTVSLITVILTSSLGIIIGLLLASVGAVILAIIVKNKRGIVLYFCYKFTIAASYYEYVVDVNGG